MDVKFVSTEDSDCQDGVIREMSERTFGVMSLLLKRTFKSTFKVRTLNFVSVTLTVTKSPSLTGYSDCPSEHNLPQLS